SRERPFHSFRLSGDRPHAASDDGRAGRLRHPIEDASWARVVGLSVRRRTIGAGVGHSRRSPDYARYQLVFHFTSFPPATYQFAGLHGDPEDSTSDGTLLAGTLRAWRVRSSSRQEREVRSG